MARRPAKARAKDAPEASNAMRVNLATALAAESTSDDQSVGIGGGGGYLEDVVTFPMTVSGAATVAGWNVWTLRAFLRDTGAFSEALVRPTHGNAAAFWLGEVMVLACWRWLGDRGIPLKRAMSLIPRALDPYGWMVNRPFERLRITMYPGDGRQPLGPATAASEAVVLDLDLWAVFDDLLPRFKTFVHSRARDPNIKAALVLFEDQMREMRSDENRVRLEAQYADDLAAHLAREAALDEADRAADLARDNQAEA